MWHLSYHGESLQLIGKRAAQIVPVTGVFSPFTGGIASDATGEVHEYPASRYAAVDSPSDVGALLLDSGIELLWGIYFSITRSRRSAPATRIRSARDRKVLVGAESLAGAVLVALFAFALDRRVAR